MSDNLQDRGPRDRSRVNVNESWELRYWSEKFGVTDEALKRLVREVGDRVEDIERRLGRSANR
jgi:Protein of unknown function (DUF3606)